MSEVAENKVASVHYTGTLPDTGEVFDSSVDREPLTFLVGHKNMIPGFEREIMGSKVGDKVEFTLAPEDAYGEKDAEQVETISIDKLIRAVQDPNALYIGAPVTINGRQGQLSYLAAGRARIDYNHPMAGKSLKYSFNVVDVIEGKEDIVTALLQANTGHSGFEVSFSGDDLSIVLPQTIVALAPIVAPFSINVFSNGISFRNEFCVRNSRVKDWAS